VTSLNFTIAPSAVFVEEKPSSQSTRELLRRSQNTGHRSGAGQPHSIKRDEKDPAPPPREPSSSAHFRIELISNLVYPSSAVRTVRHSRYRKYLISTTLRLNGTWVASYGGPHPPPSSNEVVTETSPYLAEALALADARTGIDGRIAVRALRSPERRMHARRNK
jgi:hypothetical protein